MAFGVAGHIHEQRVQIFETFQQIPETIKLAEDRLEEWPDDETLRDAAIELYLAVLKSVEAMIVWLVDTSTRKKIGKLLMNPKIGKPKDIGLDYIQKEVKRLQGRATTLQSKAIVRTDVNVEKTGSVVDDIKSSTQSVERIVNETYQLLRGTHLKPDIYIKENWPTDFYQRATWPSISTNGPNRNLHPTGSYLIFGEYGEFVGLTLGKLKEELVGAMAEKVRQLNSTTPQQWRAMDRAEIKAFYLLCRDIDLVEMSAYSERGKAEVPYQGNVVPYQGTVSWEPKRRRIMMQLDWFSEIEEEEHEDCICFDLCFGDP